MEKPILKHQISNKFQITITNDQNIELKRYLFSAIFVFGILNFDYCDLFGI